MLCKLYYRFNGGKGYIKCESISEAFWHMANIMEYADDFRIILV